MKEGRRTTSERGEGGKEGKERNEGSESKEGGGGGRVRPHTSHHQEDPSCEGSRGLPGMARGRLRRGSGLHTGMEGRSMDGSAAEKVEGLREILSIYLELQESIDGY